MAKKAGRLAVGSQAVALAARRGEAKLIITATDASDASVRRAKANAESNEVGYTAVPYTMFELGRSAGRGSPGTIAFLDKGLADGFLIRLAEKWPDKPKERQSDEPTVNRRMNRQQTADRTVSNHMKNLRPVKTKESDA